MKSLNEQKAPTTNQISNNKPDIIKNMNVLQGYIANSMNGGMIKPIAWLPIMAGTNAADYRLRLNIKMLTPKTPVYQKLKLVLKTFFVPNSRVWKNAEKFTAQKGGATENKIKEVPNSEGLRMYKIDYQGNQQDEILNVIMTDTDLWRDSWVSTYIPRYQTGAINLNMENAAITNLPKFNILGLRGFIAIYNDMLRNKEYDKKLDEYNNDTGLDLDYILNDFLTDVGATKLLLRGKRQNSYYTDYRTELLGENGEEPTTNNQSNELSDINEWLKKVAEYRSEAENAQANDWDIISKIRGSKKLTEGKVQLLGTKVIGLNYSSITQDTYNTNPDITEEYQAMGTQGAYSYTEAEISGFQFQEFKEEGFIHVIAQVTADTVFESGFDRMLLNVNALDQYRPDLKDLKEDVLYDIEKCGTRITQESDLTKITGFKRKFSEYFKAPNCIAGDLTTAKYYKTNFDTTDHITTLTPELTRFENQRTFAFFENNDKESGRYEHKNIWQDYTDLLINRNQAVQNEVSEIENALGEKITWVRGQNQIFFVGMHALIADLPIDENIKKNYTLWGEK